MANLPDFHFVKLTGFYGTPYSRWLTCPDARLPFSLVFVYIQIHITQASRGEREIVDQNPPFFVLKVFGTCALVRSLDINPRSDSAALRG